MSAQDIVNDARSAYDDTYQLATNALATLQTAVSGGYISLAPVLSEQADLHFDPGAPTPIVFKEPFDINPILEQIDDFIARIHSIRAPVFPETPDVKMEDHEIWDEVFFDDIKANLSSYITSMGIPDASYQNAIFNEDYERNLQILNDLYDLADAKTGARGFSYPNDFGTALKIEAQQKYQFDRSQVSRTIVKTITEWARANYQFAIDKGIVLEQAHMDFTYKYCTAFYEIYKAKVLAILEQYKAEITVISEPVALLAKEVDIYLEYGKVNAEVDKTNETLKQSRSTIEIQEALQKYSNDTSRLVSEYNQRINALQAAMQSAAGLAQANSSAAIANFKG